MGAAFFLLLYPSIAPEENHEVIEENIPSILPLSQRPHVCIYAHTNPAGVENCFQNCDNPRGKKTQSTDLNNDVYEQVALCN